MKLLQKATLLVAMLAFLFSTAFAQDEITVAYFLEWPTPNQKAQLEKIYDDAMGVKVNWIAFDTGVEMTAAMLSGHVDIAFSQGSTPFTLAVSTGIPLKIVGIAIDYIENDNCVPSASSGINKDNAARTLNGATVAVPIGTVAHYKFLKNMETVGANVNSMNIVDMAPADGAVALANGDVVMACGFGAPLRRMEELGDVLLTGAEQAASGIRVFDVISVTEEFATESPELLVEFLQVTEDMTRAYNDALADDNTSEWNEVLAAAAGMNVEDTAAMVSRFRFPDAEEQLSDAWLGGTAAAVLQDMADLFVAQGELPSSLEDYNVTIDTSFLAQVK